MCDCNSSIIPDSNQKPTKNTVITLKYHFLTLVSPNNGVSVKLSKIITFSQGHNVCNVFTNKNVDVMISLGCNTFCLLSDKQLSGLILSIFKLKPMFKTVRESHDLNVDFSFI